MKHLIIKHIGSILSVDIELDKLNVFIGPQGSGKSTIIKVLCYCSWVEKKLSLNETYKERFEKEYAFAEELVRFHKLEGYLDERTYIEYETDIIKITYSHADKVPTLVWKDQSLFQKPKISYIPSERNIVAAIPNWFEVKFQDDNILNLMRDWGEARNAYKKNPLYIESLGIQYIYDNNEDRIISDGRIKFKLTHTSSGFQSLIPLYVLVDYFTNWIYKNSEPETVSKANLYSGFLKDLVYQMEKKRKETTDIESFFDDWTTYSNYTRTVYTNFFIEEPEQNLFPKTQRDLVYQLVKTINTNEDHTLTLTTHSPYILSSINNLIYAAKVSNVDNWEAVEAIVPKVSHIAYDKVRAFYVDKGEAESIMDDSTRQIKAERIDEISQVLNEEYDKLLALED